MSNSRGIVLLRNDFGPSYGDMVYRIIDAVRIGLFRISLRQLLTTDDQIVLDTVMVKAKDGLRIWSSRGADGSEYVQDGLCGQQSRDRLDGTLRYAVGERDEVARTVWRRTSAAPRKCANQ